jgi:hypothetical protein
MHNLLTVMRQLYASKINAGVQSFYDHGFEVWLGDGYNGKRAINMFPADELEVAAQWLHEAACQNYPESEYARKHAHSV